MRRSALAHANPPISYQLIGNINDCDVWFFFFFGKIVTKLVVCCKSENSPRQVKVIPSIASNSTSLNECYITFFPSNFFLFSFVLFSCTRTCVCACRNIFSIFIFLEGHFSRKVFVARNYDDKTLLRFQREGNEKMGNGKFLVSWKLAQWSPIAPHCCWYFLVGSLARMQSRIPHGPMIFSHFFSTTNFASFLRINVAVKTKLTTIREIRLWAFFKFCSIDRDVSNVCKCAFLLGTRNIL